MAKRPHVAAGIVALAMLLTAASTGLAQVTFQNAPCGTITVYNTGLCTVQLRVVPVPAGWPNPIVVAAGGWVVLPGPPAGAALTINGITSLGGIFYPFNPPPPSGAGCGATSWWIARVTLGPAPGCCYDVCADPAACRIILVGAPVPPPCNP